MGELKDQAKKRFVIKIDSSLITGPAGADGADGTVVTFPIDASDVIQDGSIRTGELLSDLLNELLHVPIAISSLASASGVTFEKGQSLASLNITWGLNITPATQTISGTNIAVPPTLGVGDRAATVNFSPNLTSNGFIQLDVDDGLGLAGSTDSDTLNLAFTQKLHWGLADIPGAINSAFVLALSNNNLQTNRLNSFTLNSGADQYIWVAYPASYGPATFYAGGFAGGFEPAVNIDHLNASGYNNQVSVDGGYYVYRSTNKDLGITTVNIT